MNKIMKSKKISGVVVGVLIFLMSTLALAVEFVPYPGKRSVTLVSIDAANIIVATFPTDSDGFYRTLRITLPDLVVAEDTPRSDDCERAKAAQALPFTQAFLNDAKNIFIQDLRMVDSGDDFAISPILTEQGSLAAALEKEGLARSDAIDSEVSWCK